MVRAFALAVGITAVILGVECLVLEKAIMADSKEPEVATTANPFVEQVPQTSTKAEVVPPEWAPWSLLGGGAVIILYALTLKRSQG